MITHKEYEFNIYDKEYLYLCVYYIIFHYMALTKYNSSTFNNLASTYDEHIQLSPEKSSPQHIQ